MTRTAGRSVRTRRTPATRSQMRARDALSIGFGGLRARPVRALLSALGIAIAIASLVAVLGIAASTSANFLTELGSEANLLTVAAGQTFTGNPTPLPPTAEAMIGAIRPVMEVTAVGNVTSATVRRSAAVPPINTGGITVLAAEPTFLSTVGGSVLQGHFLDALAQRYPEVVLGYSAAENLGIATLDPTTQVYLAGSYFTVVGVLAPVSTAPEVDDAALVSFPVAATVGLPRGEATRIYLRVQPDQVAAVAAVLPFTASPETPEAVEVRRPSDILRARLTAKTAFVSLYLGLGGIALLVGAVGIANTMIISVLERRAEIGLRRALGARRRHVALQFLVESAALAATGGAGGIALGIVTTVIAARVAGNSVALPAQAPLLGMAAAIVVGVIAGIYPAVRAARLAPAEALRAL